MAIPAAASARDLGLELQTKTVPTDLIIAVDNGDPTIFYYAHRKGWHFTFQGKNDFRRRPRTEENLTQSFFRSDDFVRRTLVLRKIANERKNRRNVFQSSWSDLK
jgi:hypothetical protein